MARRAMETKVKVVSDTVIVMDDFSFTDNYVNGARAALISTFDQNVLLTFDGTDPAMGTGLGHMISATYQNWFMVEGIRNVPNIKLVRATGSDAKVTITLLK